MDARAQRRRRWLLAFIAIGLVHLGPGDANPRKRQPNMPRGWVWPPDAAMKKLGSACLTELTELGVAWKRARPTLKVATPIVVRSMELGGLKLSPTYRKPPFVMDCHLALALTKAAPLILEQGVSVLRFSSIHDYRNVRRNGRTKSSLSRHAVGLAVDVFELVTEDGTKIIIEDEYAASARAQAVEEAITSTGLFRTVLSPKSDPVSHYDHFHLEARMKIPRPRRAKRGKKRRVRRRRRR